MHRGRYGKPCIATHCCPPQFPDRLTGPPSKRMSHGVRLPRRNPGSGRSTRSDGDRRHLPAESRFPVAPEWDSRPSAGGRPAMKQSFAHAWRPWNVGVRRQADSPPACRRCASGSRRWRPRRSRLRTTCVQACMRRPSQGHQRRWHGPPRRQARNRNGRIGKRQALGREGVSRRQRQNYRPDMHRRNARVPPLRHSRRQPSTDGSARGPHLSPPVATVALAWHPARLYPST